MLSFLLVSASILSSTDCNENFKTTEVRIIGPGATKIVELFLGKSKCKGKEMFKTVSDACKVSRPIDCSDLGHGKCDSGAYKVYPNNTSGFNAYCTIDDDNKGWTVFQRRMNGKVDFYRDWKSYKEGFGNFNEDFWLGNDNLHRLTAQGNYMLRIDLEDFENNKRYAEYTTFKVGNEKSGYKLTVSGYKGDAGDSFTYHSGMLFTTRDKDNDRMNFNCARVCSGAWWYKSCYFSSLNSLYISENYTNAGWKGICWSKWHGNHYSLKKTEMKIRRV